MPLVELYFSRQTYPALELIFVDGPENIGDKRNSGCEMANGEYIAHMDSDDWYSPDWISVHMDGLLSLNAEMIGLSSAYFYDFSKDISHFYDYPADWRTSILGATMVYTKEYWQRTKFDSMIWGEDSRFSQKCNKVALSQYQNGFVAMRHDSNKGGSSTNYKPFRPFNSDHIKQILGKDIELYRDL